MDLSEKLQQSMLVREQRQQQIFGCIMYSIAIYFIGHYYFEIWNPSVIFSEFLIATAIVITICVKKLSKK